MGSFAVDVAKFGIKSREKADRALRAVAFAGYAGLTKRSPVDTGRFRANWMIGVNTPDLTTTPAPTGSTTAASVNVAASARLGKIKFGQTIHITNNLPYARRLETGWSKQAPTGVLGPTFQALRAQLPGIIRQIAST